MNHVKTAARDILYGLCALKSWDEYRAFMAWDRARHGLGPITDEHLVLIKRAMGEPPRVNAQAWDRYALEVKASNV